MHRITAAHSASEPHEPRDFPTPADLPVLPVSDAARVLNTLSLLHEEMLAEVYTQPYTGRDGERPRWNVWIGHQLTPDGLGERTELREWAERYLATGALYVVPGFAADYAAPEGGRSC